MYDAKIRKAYLPQREDNKSSHHSLENKKSHSSVSPIHDMRKERYKVKNKEEKKGMLEGDLEKKSPAWLNKKKSSFVYQKDSLTKDKKNKSIEDKKFSPQRIKPL